MGVEVECDPSELVVPPHELKDVVEAHAFQLFFTGLVLDPAPQ